MFVNALPRDRESEVSAPPENSADGSDRRTDAGDVTRILRQAAHCRAHRAEELLPLVYDELRRLANERLAGEKPGQTLQGTALVHEAYLRLINVDHASCWDNRNHFFVAAAEAMRRILVENARRKAGRCHGGGFRRQFLDLEMLPLPHADLEILAIDEALAKLSGERPEVAHLVQLHYFAGLTLDETAALLNVSVRTAHRYWAYARAWLYQELAPAPHRPTSDNS